MSRWYSIENKAAGNPTVYVYDEIGGYGISAHEFIKELDAIEADEIDVHINSVGGEVFQGFAMYQALRDHPAKINVKVDALAASIASVIAMAGDEIEMGTSAQMMIHDGHVAIQGNSADLSKMVGQLERCSDNIASVYAERCGGDLTAWRDAMRAETWFTAEEAVQAGLADSVAKKSRRRARNVADLEIFNYAGRQFAPAPKILDVDTSKTEPYGEVEYADPGYQSDGKKRYPIDTEEHVRAAWSYINQEDNASQYSAGDLAKVKERIRTAAKKFGIQIADSAFDAKAFVAALKEAFDV